MNTRSTFLVVLTIFVSIHYQVDARAPFRIVNGTAADEGEFPYMVQLRDPFGFFVCGGGIIEPKWILTAGHCVEKLLYSIVYGTNKLYDFDSGDVNTSIVIRQKFQHPKYSTDSEGIPSYDIGLLELETPIPYSATAQPIQLAGANASVPFHVEGVLSGWGVNETYGDAEEALQKIYLPLLSDEECINKINGYSRRDNFNPIHHLCSDDYYNGECFGDSGSPFVVNNLVYGTVSWSYKPCGIVPGTYSRLTNPEYRDWVTTVTGI